MLLICEEAIACAGSDVPEYAGGKLPGQGTIDEPSQGLLRSSKLAVTAKLTAQSVDLLADLIERDAQQGDLVARVLAKDASAPETSPGYLGLIVDNDRRTVRRKGCGATVDLSQRDGLWHIFKAMFQAADRGASREAILDVNPGAPEALRQTKEYLKDELTPLGITMPHSKWKLVTDGT